MKTTVTLFASLCLIQAAASKPFNDAGFDNQLKSSPINQKHNYKLISFGDEHRAAAEMKDSEIGENVISWDEFYDLMRGVEPSKTDEIPLKSSDSLDHGLEERHYGSGVTNSNNLPPTDDFSGDEEEFLTKPDNFDGYNRDNEIEESYNNHHPKSPVGGIDEYELVPSEFHDDDKLYFPEIPKPETTPKTADKFNSWISKLFGKDFKSSVSNVYNETKNVIHKTSNDIWKRLKVYYDKLQRAMKELKKWFSESISGFGLMVQKGANYMAERSTIVFDDERASEILHSLEEKLKEGDEEVSKYFELMGQKLADWSAQNQRTSELDSGLKSNRHNYNQHYGDPNYPDLFQDEEIHNELDKLVTNKIIKQDEADLLSQIKQI